MKYAKLMACIAAAALLASCAERQDGSAQQGESAAKAGAKTVAGAPNDGGIPLSATNEAEMTQYMVIRNLADRGDFIEANQAARQITEAFPDFVGGWIMLANTALSGEQFVKATSKAMKMASKGTKGEQLWADINMTFVNNDAEKRLVLGKQLVDTYPESPRAWVVYSGILSGQNMHEQARTSAGKAIKMAPDQPFAHSTLAFSYLYNDPKDFAEAEKHFQHAIELDPDEDNSWVNIGDVHRAMGDLDRARSDYSKAWELDNTNSVAAIKRGHVNSFLGNFDEARSDYDMGIATGQEGSQSTLANYRAFVNVHAGNYEAAIDELRSEVDRVDSLDMPDDQKVAARIFILTNIADICFNYDMLYDASTAIEQLSAELAQSGANAEDEDFARQQKATAVFWQGKLAAREGDYALALAKTKTFAELVAPETDPRKMERYHELLGLTALLQKDYAGAVGHYRQANLSTSPGGGDVENTYMLAKALSGAGQTEEARKLMQKVADWNFNSVWFAMLRKDAAAAS